MLLYYFYTQFVELKSRFSIYFNIKFVSFYFKLNFTQDYRYLIIKKLLFYNERGVGTSKQGWLDNLEANTASLGKMK